MLRQVVTLLGFRLALMTRAAGDTLYFGGNTRPEDLLDFRLWQGQADKLGVKLTDEDVLKEIEAEAAGGEVFTEKVPFAEQPRVRAFFDRVSGRQRGALTADDLLHALRQELRVVLTQGVLLGTEPGMRAYRSSLGAGGTPAAATPDQFLNFVRDRRASLRIKLFPVPASAYLDQVKGEPSEAELLLRYDRGSKQEASPLTREPAFKRPRRVAIEYVTADADDAYYLGLGKARLIAGQLGVLATLTTPTLSKLTPAVNDPTASEYERATKEDYGWFGNPGSTTEAMETNARRRHLASVYDSASLRWLIGGLAGGPLPALACLDGASAEVELRRTARFNLESLLYQGGLTQNLFGNAGLAVQTMPPTTPQSLLAAQVNAALEKTLASEALAANLKTFRTELSKLSTKPAQAKAYVAKAVKDYRLSLHSTQGLMTPFELLEAVRSKKAPLESLLEKLKNDPFYLFQFKPQAPPGTPDERILASYLLLGNGSYTPLPPGQQQFAAFGPVTGPVFWRSEDQAAVERTFAQVRDEIVAGWRLEKARTMARDRAEKLETELNNKKATAADAERFLREQKLSDPIELDGMAQLIRPKEAMAVLQTEYRPYQLPETASLRLPYPPPDLAKVLSKLTRPGQATVVADLPAKTFYVALLVDRSEPSLSEFKAIYERSPNNDMLYSLMQGQQREEFKKAVLAQLRREASNDIDRDGRFKLPDAMRREDALQGDIAE